MQIKIKHNHIYNSVEIYVSPLIFLYVYIHFIFFIVVPKKIKFINNHHQTNTGISISIFLTKSAVISLSDLLNKPIYFSIVNKSASIFG